MEYIKGSSLPIPEFENANPDAWYPIIDGDHALVRGIGNPIAELNELIAMLQEGDSLVASDEEIDEIEASFPDHFIRRKCWWVGDGKLEFCPAS